MGVLIARALQQNLLKDREKAEQSLREYHAFYLRELVNVATGLVCNCSGKDNSYFRLYNYPWAVTFFLECWKLWGEKENLKTAVRITEKFYEQDGFRFYPIEMPIVMLCQELEKAGEQEDLKTVRDLFRRHADQLIEIGTAYPASEVNYEQSIVQPAAEVILQVYEVTGEENTCAEPSSRSPFSNFSTDSSRTTICMKPQSATGTATGSENAESSATPSHTIGAQKTVEPSSATPA